MGVGTSMGAYYDDSFHAETAKWDSKYDNNVIDPDLASGDSIPPDDFGMEQKSIINPLLTEAGMKSQMPFPDNKNPDTDFASRFPRDMKSGILNDLKKPTGETVPLVRKIGYIGELGVNDDLSYERAEVGVNKPMTAEDAKERSKKLSPDEESYTLPGNPYLWIRKKKDGEGDDTTPMS